MRIHDVPAVAHEAVVLVVATRLDNPRAGGALVEGADSIPHALDPAEASRRVDELDPGTGASFKQRAPLLGVAFVPGFKVGVDRIDDPLLRVVAVGNADLRAPRDALASAALKPRVTGLLGWPPPPTNTDRKIAALSRSRRDSERLGGRTRRRSGGW